MKSWKGENLNFAVCIDTGLVWKLVGDGHETKHAGYEKKNTKTLTSKTYTCIHI